MSKSRSDVHANNNGSNNGAYTISEILSQPLCWSTTLKELQTSGVLLKIKEKFKYAEEWLFLGCGSSFYIAQAAAFAMTELTGLRARALPASELILFPDIALAAHKAYVPVLISRSGRTSEVLRAAELLNKRGVKTLGVSCAPGQALENLASEILLLPAADEQSMVMTRSFSTMLLALQALAATIGGQIEFAHGLKQLTPSVEKLLSSLPRRVQEFATKHEFEDYVCLGQGPLYGIACELALKLTEMSVSYGQAFHTLEFRHGPKSIVGPKTLIAFLLSERGYSAEVEAMEEIKKLGGITLAITNQANERARASADFLVELALDGPEISRVAPYLITGQLLGLYTGLKKGHDPDRPKNLSRVVILQDESPERATH